MAFSNFVYVTQMGSTKEKFSVRPTRILLLTASTFIMLSAATTAAAAAEAGVRQCYWCGPLAEQVHRSRRAPPCDETPTEAHITACEPGHTHCATVATSPPHIESRYCVKLYQDECYPLFCNSTKTWKMTCPCRGDLCNGPNTDRENEAFTVLSKLVAKTHARIKKAAIATPQNSFFPMNNGRNPIVTNITIMENSKENNSVTDNNITEINQEMHSNHTNIVQHNVSVDNPVNHIIDKDEKINVEITAVPENKSLEIEESNDEHLKMTTLPAVLINKTITEEPLKQLPTAEALQQNSNPVEMVEKITEVTTMSYEHTTSPQDDDIEVTVKPTKDDKNSAVILYFKISYILSGIFLNIYL